MKKQERSLRSCLIALYMLFSIQGIQAVVWNGLAAPVSVTDDDLILDAANGDITLAAGQTRIDANTVDITVTLQNGDVTIQSDMGEATLILKPDLGRTITFDLTGLFDLTFLGSTDGTTRLLMVHEGEGEVEFVMTGGRTLRLSNTAENGPVEFYLMLKIVDEYTPKPLLSFVRDDATILESNRQIYIEIGPLSLLSYASYDGLINESIGCIEFSPINDGTGRMVVQVENTGAFTMAVHQATLGEGGFHTINRDTPAGGIATTHIIKDTSMFDEYTLADACLLVTNYNSTYAEYLIDPYGDLGAATDVVDFSGLFDGFRYGVSAGANHILFVDDGACLDYVGLANNSCPTPLSLPGIIDPEAPTDVCPCPPTIEQYLKLRNYSAFTIDGWFNPFSQASIIQLGVQSGIYFRSGIDAEGNIISDDLNDPHVFTINPNLLFTAGAGEYVFDVEAELQVFGSNINTTEVLNSRIEILSLEVAPNSGPLFPVEGTGTNFNARTFALDVNDNLYRYNKAAWLINDRAIFTDTAIAHTDENHLVCENNDIISEPTYVGGEKWWLSVLREEDPLVPHPLMGFQDGLFQIQASVALTGVDLLMPTFVQDGDILSNQSVFRFYSNGYLVDNGTGRAMILGTLIGSQACDGCTIISADAHLDIYQDADYIFPPLEDPIQTLSLTVSENNSAVNNAITTDIIGQTSIHTIYLGHNSNISIGVNAPFTGFTNDTSLALFIAGNFFHFGTRGGSLGIPSTSAVTGQGGIFVDLNGTFAILPDFIASIDAMVVKSHNGIVDLPPTQVYFSDGVGITQWQQNLADNPVIISTGTHISDYTLNWLSVIKDPGFMPYIVQNVNICSCPEVTEENILNIPVVQGEVNQLQVVNSRIGDPAHILIDGGWVREILWLSDCRAAEAPVAVIVLQAGGRVGLNNAHRNVDSVFTQTILGVNGINIVANGSGRVDLNDDMIVDNVCAFLQGPFFQAGDQLDIQSDVPYTLRVTKDGVLDFSHFTTVGKIRFGENIRVNLEPGATIVLGAATVEFGDGAVVEVESSNELALRITALDSAAGPIDNSVNPLVSVNYTQPNNQYSPLTGYGAGLLNTDPYRVRILGVGTMAFTDNASLIIRTNGILSVETQDLGGCNVQETNVTLGLDESAEFNIGIGNNIRGGVFQVGNVVPLQGSSVDFTLIMNGPNATFGLGSGGFLGFGAGVVRPNQEGGLQSDVIADTLFNVRSVVLNIQGGNFKADRVFNSDDARSHSMVLGSVASFEVQYPNIDTIAELDAANFLISGGGNLFLMLPGDENDFGGIRLIDRTDDDIIDAPFPTLLDPENTVPLIRLRDGILASSEQLDLAQNITGTVEDAFLAIKVSEVTAALGRSTGIAVAAPVDPARFREARTLGLLGYVDRAMIGRQVFADLVSTQGASQDDRRQDAYNIGAARVIVDTSVEAPGPVLIASSILN